MKRVVAAVQLVAVVCAVAFVVLLFANEPDDAPAAGAGDTEVDAGEATGGADDSGGDDGVDGAEVYRANCAGCHGRDGGGGVGPQLSGGHVAEHFPDIEDQIELIAEGEGRMPAFGSRLSEDEIRAVAEYERSL